MAPIQSIKFQTANFPIFRARIIVIFWTTCIAREIFLSCDNDKQILSVLQWLEVVIAFVSSLSFVFCADPKIRNASSNIAIQWVWKNT